MKIPSISEIKSRDSPRKSKTEGVFNVLIHILNQESENIDEDALVKKFPYTFPKVKSIFESYSFVKRGKRKSSDGKYKKVYAVIPSEALDKASTLGSLISYQRDRSDQWIYHLSTLFMSLAIVMLTSVQLLNTFYFQENQHTLAIQTYDYATYPYKPFLDIKSIDLKIDRRTNMSVIELCILNKGGIDSGTLHLNMYDNKQLSLVQSFPELKSKTYRCDSITFPTNLTDYNPTNLAIEINCLNCETHFGGSYDISANNV